jgi:hypothetical protein
MLWTPLHGFSPAIDQQSFIDVKYNLVECNNNNIDGLLTCKRTFSLTHFIWSNLACEWRGHVLTSISYYKIVYNPNRHVRHMTSTEKVSHKYLIWDTTDVIRGAGKAYTSAAPPVFSEIHVARSVVFWVVFCRSFFVLFVTLSHFVVCPSSIFWYLQTLLWDQNKVGI